MSTSIECLRCGCPASIEGDDEWLCPMCGCGFVSVVLRVVIGP